jgi:hypothetical protein
MQVAMLLELLLQGTAVHWNPTESHKQDDILYQDGPDFYGGRLKQQRGAMLYTYRSNRNTPPCVASLYNYPRFTHYCEVDYPVRSTVQSAQILP